MTFATFKASAHRRGFALAFFNLALLLAWNPMAYAISYENADWISPDAPTGIEGFIELETLHPTQFTVGEYEVERRAKKIAKMNQKAYERYLEEKIAPVVIGPGGTFYLIDRHHLGKALLANRKEKMLARVKANFSNLTESEFWTEMILRKWTYLIDENHNLVQDPKKLPKSLLQMKDDPYRALAGDVRDAGGFKKIDLPFIEFQWAEFFAKHIAIAPGREGYKKALQQAMVLAHSPLAQGLPGYIKSTCTAFFITQK